MRHTLIVLMMLPAVLSAAVQDISYPSPKGGTVPAFLVVPGGKAPHPAVIFQHWGLGDRHAFLDDARELARYGVVSLLPDAPFNRPNGPKDENEDLLQAVADIRAGIDYLTKRSDIDPKRIGFVGLSYGAHVGALLAAQEPRFATLILAGGLASNADAEKDPKLAPYDAEKWIAKTHAAPVFLQFALHDEYIDRAQADRFIKAASNPAIYKWYEGNHAFNASARDDRLSWLAAHLGFTIPDVPYRQVDPHPSRSSIGKLGVVFEMPGMNDVPVKRDITFKPGMKMDLYYPFGMVKSDRIPAIIAVNGQSSDPAFMKAMRGARFATTFAQALTVRANRIVVMPDIRMQSEGDPAADLRDLVKYLTDHADELQIDKNQFGIIARSAGYAYALKVPAKALAVWYGNLGDAPVVKETPMLVVTAQHDFWYDAAQTQKYIEATGAKHIHLPDGDHGFEIFDDLEQSRDAFLQTVRFLREQLPIKR